MCVDVYRSVWLFRSVLIFGFDVMFFYLKKSSPDGGGGSRNPEMRAGVLPIWNISMRFSKFKLYPNWLHRNVNDVRYNEMFANDFLCTSVVFGC